MVEKQKNRHTDRRERERVMATMGDKRIILQTTIVDLKFF